MMPATSGGNNTGNTLIYCVGYLTDLMLSNICQQIQSRLMLHEKYDLMCFLGPRVLSEVHQMEQPREGGVQAGGQQGGVPAVGDAQEQARHELRDDGQGTEVILMGWWH